MSLSFINKQVDIYFQQASVGLSNTQFRWEKKKKIYGSIMCRDLSNKHKKSIQVAQNFSICLVWFSQTITL